MHFHVALRERVARSTVFTFCTFASIVGSSGRSTRLEFSPEIHRCRVDGEDHFLAGVE